MTQDLDTIKICKSLLTAWKNDLDLTNYEKEKHSTFLSNLDIQLEKLRNRVLQICVFGRVGVGKSSLLNAIINKNIFETDITHGCTQKINSYEWGPSFKTIDKVEFIDTPGIDEISAKDIADLSYRTALKADLILFVIDSDLSLTEQSALQKLIMLNKPILLVLNRCDQWVKDEIKLLLKSIKDKLPATCKDVEIALVASAPRQPQVMEDGRVRSEPEEPKIKALCKALKVIIDRKGDFLLAINSLKQADELHQSLKEKRLKKNKLAAQSLIGKFATIKASGIAINPILMIDVATGFACDTALIIQLSKVYGLKIGGKGARDLVKKISIHNAFLGGTQIGINMALDILKKLLLIASPLTGGLSLASAAPVAIAQAALAVHTTQLTGRLAAKKFLESSSKSNTKPSLMLKDLLRKNRQFKVLINEFRYTPSSSKINIEILLP